MPDWLVILSLLATAGASIFGARYAGRSSVKVKQLDVDGQAYVRADQITQGLIKRLEEQITHMIAARAADSLRIDRIEAEVREVREHNNALTRYCYRLIDLLRTVGHGDKIPTPPPHGIHL